MRCKKALLAILPGLWLLFILALIFTSGQAIRVASAQSPTPTVSPGPGSQNNQQKENDYTPALIGLAGVLAAALIGIGGVGYKSYSDRKIEKLKAELQSKAEQEKAKLQLENEKEKTNLLKELERAKIELTQEKEHHERERQRQEVDDQENLQKMERAKNNEERGLAYRESLKADPRIAKLQVLEMNSPLEVATIYVRLRLHQEVGPKYELESELLLAETHRDPNELIKAGFLRRENRASAALDPVDAIEKYKRCVVVGDPGAGKSTLLKYLALKTVGKQAASLPDLPILIELNDFTTSGHQNLLDYIAERWDRRYGFPRIEARTFIEEKLEKGEALLLLDALDETVVGENAEAAEAAYSRVSKLIEEASARFPKAPLVVTARKAGYYQRRKLEGFAELEVLDFNKDDIKQFINNWFACLPNPHQQASAADLINKLERNSRIQALASNPLLLTLIVIVYLNELDLPDRRAELYRQCLETLLTRWDTTRQIKRRREFKTEHKRQLLGEIAWYFHRQGRRYFPEKELLKVIGEFLPAVGLSESQNGAILAEITAEQGVIKEQAQGWYGFLHLTFQEYCAATHVVGQGLLDQLLEQRHEAWWEEVILLYAGHAPDAGSLLSKLAGLDKAHLLREDIFSSNLLLAGRSLAAHPTVRNQLTRTTIIEALFDKLKKAKFNSRKFALVLAEIGGEALNQPLLELLQNPNLNISICRHIASALGQLGDKSVITPLLDLLKDPNLDGFVRRHIALALGQLGDKSVVTPLLDLLKDLTLASHVRGEIAFLLGQLGAKSAVTSLLDLLKDLSLASHLRREIALALRQLGDKSVVTPLLDLLKGPNLDSFERGSIALALGQLGDKSVITPLLDLLKDPNLYSEVRDRIASALGQLAENEQDILELVRILQGLKISINFYAILEMIAQRTAARFYWENDQERGTIEVVFSR